MLRLKIVQNILDLYGIQLIMKTRASVKADPSKGDKLVRRRGRLYVINKRNPNRKQRQKGPALKK